MAIQATNKATAVLEATRRYLPGDAELDAQVRGDGGLYVVVSDNGAELCRLTIDAEGIIDCDNATLTSIDKIDAYADAMASIEAAAK